MKVFLPHYGDPTGWQDVEVLPPCSDPLRMALERREEMLWADGLHPLHPEVLDPRSQEMPFMLDERGAGIYPADAHWLIPKGQGIEWMRKHLAPLIQWTDWPRRVPKELTFYHTGCLGDLVASLPIIRHLGGAHLVVGNYTRPDWQWKNMEGARYQAILPLLERQSYVKSVRFETGASATHFLDDIGDGNMPGWRSLHRKDRTLTASQADWLGIREPISMTPWLENVTPDWRGKGKIVVARTERYHNEDFPWRKVVVRNLGRILFIGLPGEAEKFERKYGPVEYVETKTLLEAAQLIAGSECFVGNQSSPMWLAMGLGHPLIQETSPLTQDSMVEGPRAVFYRDGKLVAPRGARISV